MMGTSRTNTDRLGIALIVIAAISLVSVVAESARAVTIVLKGQSEPIHAYLVRADEMRVVIRVAQPDGTWKERTLARGEIDVFHEPVDVDRLAALDPARPKDYSDYAEELAEKRVDPEARDASLRLYLIAARLDPGSLGRGSLLGMTSLARSDAEADRFRAMAFLLDPAHDPRLLQRTARPSIERDQPIPMSIDTRSLWRALEMLRKGHELEANQLGKRPGIEALFARYADLLTQEEFLAACGERGRRAVPPGVALTTRILRIERRITAELLGIATADGAVGADWSQLSSEQAGRVARPLRLEALTEFDPAAVIYRDGQWRVP